MPPDRILCPAVLLVLFFSMPCPSGTAWATEPPLAPPVEQLSQQEIGSLFDKIDRGERIAASLLHRALAGPQFTLRADAARLLGAMGDLSSVPYLIDSLSDESSHEGRDYPDAGMATTCYWANESLKKLTREDFGFAWNSPERKDSVARWKRWYRTKNGRPTP